MLQLLHWIVCGPDQTGTRQNADDIQRRLDISGRRLERVDKAIDSADTKIYIASTIQALLFTFLGIVIGYSISGVTSIAAHLHRHPLLGFILFAFVFLLVVDVIALYRTTKGLYYALTEDIRYRSAVGRNTFDLVDIATMTSEDWLAEARDRARHPERIEEEIIAVTHLAAKAAKKKIECVYVALFSLFIQAALLIILSLLDISVATLRL